MEKKQIFPMEEFQTGCVDTSHTLQEMACNSLLPLTGKHQINPDWWKRRGGHSTAHLVRTPQNCEGHEQPRKTEILSWSAVCDTLDWLLEGCPKWIIYLAKRVSPWRCQETPVIQPERLPRSAKGIFSIKETMCPSPKKGWERTERKARPGSILANKRRRQNLKRASN